MNKPLYGREKGSGYLVLWSNRWTFKLSKLSHFNDMSLISIRDGITVRLLRSISSPFSSMTICANEYLINATLFVGKWVSKWMSCYERKSMGVPSDATQQTASRSAAYWLNLRRSHSIWDFSLRSKKATSVSNRITCFHLSFAPSMTQALISNSRVS